MSYIKGIYEKHIFKSDKGYIIGLLKLEETDEENLRNYIGKVVTFTGTFHELIENELYKMEGNIKEHPRYGTQFEVINYEKLKPSDKDGIIAFLSSDLFPKIGKKLATNIVDTLGLKALDLILEDPACLQLVPKMTSLKSDIIYNVLLKYDESHQVILYLTDLGFSMNEALLIYNFYLKDTIKAIEDNIFKLVDDINDLSFPKIDQISKKFLLDQLDKRRIKACIIYIFKSVTFATGNTYLSYDEVYNNVCNYFNEILDSNLFDACLEDLIIETRVVQEEINYYLKEMYDATNNIVNKVRILLNNKKNKYNNLDNLIDNLEKNTNIKYNDKQINAIKSALLENILIITGGPGTGKTTIIKAIVELYSQICKVDYGLLTECNYLALLAPTGRAAKRLSESTGLSATTIHRFLKWNKDANKFSVNEHDKSKVKFVIIDEVSMIDEALFDSLLKGLTDNIRLVLVGDYNQLPSVSQGQLLKDFIESETIKTIELDYLYRQDENSYIISLAQEVKNNNLSPCFLEPKSDFIFLKCSNVYIKDALKKICLQILEKGYDYKRFQMMAPMYKGENGIDNLNKVLQEILNPPSYDKNELQTGDIIYREKDKVLQLVNMPEDNVYNGDIGIIKRITTNNKTEIEVEYDYGSVIYTPKDFSKIKHAFIITIHKSQGSEFDLVVMPITNEYYRMLYRKLIYTGITRAKKKLIIIGNPSAFESAVKNDKDLTRNTSLKEKLIIMHNYLEK